MSTLKEFCNEIDHLQKRLTELMDENARLRGVIEGAKLEVLKMDGAGTMNDILNEVEKGVLA